MGSAHRPSPTSWFIPTIGPLSVSTPSATFSKSVSVLLLFKTKHSSHEHVQSSCYLCESSPSVSLFGPLHSRKILLPFSLCSCNTLNMSQVLVLIFCNCVTFLFWGLSNQRSLRTGILPCSFWSLQCLHTTVVSTQQAYNKGQWSLRNSES